MHFIIGGELTDNVEARLYLSSGKQINIIFGCGGGIKISPASIEAHCLLEKPGGATKLHLKLSRPPGHASAKRNHPASIKEEIFEFARCVLVGKQSLAQAFRDWSTHHMIECAKLGSAGAVKFDSALELAVKSAKFSASVINDVDRANVAAKNTKYVSFVWETLSNADSDALCGRFDGHEDAFWAGGDNHVSLPTHCIYCTELLFLFRPDRTKNMFETCTFYNVEGAKQHDCNVMPMWKGKYPIGGDPADNDPEREDDPNDDDSDAEDATRTKVSLVNADLSEPVLPPSEREGAVHFLSPATVEFDGEKLSFERGASYENRGLFPKMMASDRPGSFPLKVVDFYKDASGTSMMAFNWLYTYHELPRQRTEVRSHRDFKRTYELAVGSGIWHASIESINCSLRGRIASRREQFSGDEENAANHAKNICMRSYDERSATPKAQRLSFL